MAGKIGFDEKEKLEKAMAVFWQKGYQGTSMHDLVDAMLINRSSLYNTFGDKHDLFLSCLSYYSDIMYHNYELVVKKGNNALDTLLNIIDEGVNLAIGRLPTCMATKAVFELSPVDADAFHILKKDEERIIQLLTTLVKQAKKAQQINVQYEPGMLATFIYAQFPGWRRSFMLHSDPKLIHQMAVMLKNILMK